MDGLKPHNASQSTSRGPTLWVLTLRVLTSGEMPGSCLWPATGNGRERHFPRRAENGFWKGTRLRARHEGRLAGHAANSPSRPSADFRGGQLSGIDPCGALPHRTHIAAIIESPVIERSFRSRSWCEGSLLATGSATGLKNIRGCFSQWPSGAQIRLNHSDRHARGVHRADRLVPGGTAPAPIAPARSTPAGHKRCSGHITEAQFC